MFAKLFNLPDGRQVLVTKEYDEAKDRFITRQRYELGDDLTFEGDISAASEETRDAIFDNFEEHNAVHFADVCEAEWKNLQAQGVELVAKADVPPDAVIQDGGDMRA